MFTHSSVDLGLAADGHVAGFANTQNRALGMARHHDILVDLVTGVAAFDLRPRCHLRAIPAAVPNMVRLRKCIKHRTTSVVIRGPAGDTYADSQKLARGAGD